MSKDFEMPAPESAFDKLLHELHREHMKGISLLQAEVQVLRLQISSHKDAINGNSNLAITPAVQSRQSSKQSHHALPTGDFVTKKIMSVAADSEALNRHVSGFLHHKVSGFQHIGEAAQASLGKKTFEKFAQLRGWTPEDSDEQTHLVARIVQHQCFDTISAVAIIMNSILLGSMTSHSASTYGIEPLPEFYDYANNVFTCWFLLEVILRWVAEGFLRFCLSANRYWNAFDCLVVGTDLVETSIQLLTSADDQSLGNLTLMRMLRVLRIARALRVVRLLHFCKELRMMVLSILRSGTALIWSMVLLALIIYVFSIFIMQAVTQYLAEYVSDRHVHGEFQGFVEGSIEATLVEEFGSLHKSCYTLFLAVSGGISWYEVGDPLGEVHWSNVLIFCFYIFFTIFAMLNIITGIFVETAINSVQNDKDEIIQEELKSDNSYIKQLQRIFQDADSDHDGKITLDEFERVLQKKRTYATLSGMGLKVSEARGMFTLLDSAHTGWVSIEDFLVGCMRLRGGARAVDLITLLYDHRSLMDLWSRFSICVEKDLRSLRDFESRTDHVMAGLVQSVHDLSHNGQGRVQGRPPTNSAANEPVKLQMSSNSEQELPDARFKQWREEVPERSGSTSQQARSEELPNVNRKEGDGEQLPELLEWTPSQPSRCPTPASGLCPGSQCKKRPVPPIVQKV